MKPINATEASNALKALAEAINSTPDEIMDCLVGVEISEEEANLILDIL